MDINVTLLVEIITFAGLVFLTMKYIWPPIIKAIEDRQKKIADGLAAGERGERGLELARKNAKEQMLQAKAESSKIIGQANKESSQIVERARKDAEEVNKSVLALAKEEIVAETERANLQTRKYLVDLVIDASTKVLGKSVDKSLVDKVIEEI